MHWAIWNGEGTWSQKFAMSWWIPGGAMEDILGLAPVGRPGYGPVPRVGSGGATAQPRSRGASPPLPPAPMSRRKGTQYDPNRVPGPNPNNLRQRAVETPTAGEGGVYLKPKKGKTKIGSTGDYRKRYGPDDPNGIEVEIPLTRTGPPDGIDDSDYQWTEERQRRFDEEYVDRTTPKDARYRDPANPRSPVSPEKWEKYRHIFGYGDLPADFGQ